ncbi:MAG TPA: SDR family NAD(P)-dependent oxidoreductase, partial [Actinophytocola sp.]|nr:SDR family NAD(P)-dependent oxidoreductase [Actinophytocola sp.]
SSRSTVVAGDEDAVERFLAEMEGLGAFCQKVEVDYASHCSRMDALLPGLREDLSDVAPGAVRVPFYSSVTGEPLSGPELDGDYWCRNLREPVRFDRALERLRADGHGVFVEVSPHPVLAVALAHACESDESAVVLGSLRRDRGGTDQLVRALSELHVQGYPVGWERVLTGRKVDVPTYAFQRQRYWLDEPRSRTSTTTTGQLPGEHPWIGAMTTLAGNPGYLLMGRLSLAEHPWLADHVVAGAVLVPGAGLLDVALSAAHAVGADAVADLTLLEPLVLTESSALRLQATVGAPDSRGRRPFALHSQPEDTAEPLTWQQHVTGELATRAGERAPTEDLRTWPVPDARAVDRDDFYARALSEGLAYGPAFQCLRELVRRDDVFYGHVRLPESLDPTGYGLHPALLDAALQVVVAGLLESSTGSGPLVPFIWSDIELYRAGATELLVRVDLDHGGNDDPAPATVWLADPAGDPVARIGLLKFQRGRPGRHVEHLYRVGFENAPLADDATLVDTAVVGDLALGAALGVEVVSDLDALLDPGAEVPGQLLFTAEPPDPEEAAADALRSLRRCLADPRLQRTELVWITRHAVSSSPDDEVGNWAHASIWGLVRVARTEQPERVLRMVDLDADAPDPTLLARVLRTRNEPEWVLRGGTALVPRVRPVHGGGHPPRALDPDGTVLVTGGLGELGGALAAHLVRAHGVRRLVLSSRRGADTPAADTLVGDLEAAGAEQVRVVACDVADRAAVAALLDDVDPAHPLTAVFHLAGVLDDGLVPGFTEERLHRVMAPKARGARHLDELTEGLDLAAFVLFSSAAGTLGTAGQSGYAAANATLDALAAHRRRRGLPGTSLAFGLWEQAGVGMTAHLGKAELGRLRRQGIGALTLDEGFRALDLALTRPEPYLVPVHLELASLRHALGNAEPPGLLRALVPPRVDPPGADTPEDEPSLHDRMVGISEPERLAVLVEVVRGEVAAVLGLPGPDGVPGDKALRSLGIDSLTMIELRKRLSKRANTSLPATLVFDYPTADAIAGLLLRDGSTR